MRDHAALTEALAVFNRIRGSAVKSVEAAIEVYNRCAWNNFVARTPRVDLTVSMMDTEGDGMALVISGFKNEEELSLFMQERFNAPSK